MKPGAGKTKGAAFERLVCKRLSLWVSGGRQKDIFYRSSMSGGRATVLSKKGESWGSVAGDICSVHPLGHKLTDKIFFECKHLKDAYLLQLLIKQSGPLLSYWDTVCDQASKYNKLPCLIVKQNFQRDLLFFPVGRVSLGFPALLEAHPPRSDPYLVFHFDDFLELDFIQMTFERNGFYFA